MNIRNTVNTTELHWLFQIFAQFFNISPVYIHYYYRGLNIFHSSLCGLKLNLNELYAPVNLYTEWTNEKYPPSFFLFFEIGTRIARINRISF